MTIKEKIEDVFKGNVHFHGHDGCLDWDIAKIVLLVEEGVKAEREACAEIAKKHIDPDDKDDPELWGAWKVATTIEKEIRERKDS